MSGRILTVTPAEYHQLPGLSSSLAHTLISRSPAHCYAQAPTLGGAAHEHTAATDRGTICHDMLLGHGPDVVPLQYDDWRTKAAREDRDKARSEGKIPVLQEDYDECQVIVGRFREQLDVLSAVDPRIPPALTGLSEVPIAWEEPLGTRSVECRALLDHVLMERNLIIDLKFVRDASQDHIDRSGEEYGYAIQAAAYRRALRSTLPPGAYDPTFMFAFMETSAPYLLHVVSPDGIFAEVGERRWLRAVETWDQCMRSGRWPGYATKLGTITVPAWKLAKEDL